MFLLRLLKHGPRTFYAGVLLRRKARAAGKYPSPMKPSFLVDLAWSIASRGPMYTAPISQTVNLFYDRAVMRLDDPLRPVERYHYIVDELLKLHQMAGLPEIIDEVASPEMAALQKETKDIMRGKFS